MKTTLKLMTVAAFVTVLSTAAMAQHAPGHNTPAMDRPAMQKMMQDMMPKEGDAASTKAFKEAHMKMMHATSMQFTGNADVDFARQMIPHHQGAIDMAKV